MMEREHRIPWHPPDFSGVCEPGVRVGGRVTDTLQFGTSEDIQVPTESQRVWESI